MRGTFVVGERKTRPGTYFNIQKSAESNQADSINGVVAVIFRSNFGPLNKAVEISVEDGYESLFGTDKTTDAMREAFLGGAKTIIACRVGNDDGTKGKINLAGTSGSDSVKITAKYPGSKAFTVTVKEKITNAAVKQCIIYDGTTEFESVEFKAGTGEAKALVEALRNSKNFDAEIGENAGSDTITNVSQAAFSAGTDPKVTNADYANAFEQVEAYEFNTICVDTEDNGVHMLLQAFVNRVFDAGLLLQAVVAEKYYVDFDTKKEHAASFNDEKMNYILNAHLSEQGTEIDGYQTAARIAGMIAAVPANKSLTHTVLNGITEIKDKLTNTQIKGAEESGCIVLSYNSDKQVWIDNAINTLVTPADNQDNGWKKIRRVKARFELIKRMNLICDNLVGLIDNDKNGRATVISQLNEVGQLMVSEGKLISCEVREDENYNADGDSAWFNIDVVDKDSLEHIYLTYTFRFSTNV